MDNVYLVNCYATAKQTAGIHPMRLWLRVKSQSLSVPLMPFGVITVPV